MNWRSRVGKSNLIKMLMQEHDVPKRKAEEFVNAVFNVMARGLRRGDIVELPIGWMQTARPPANRRKEKLQNFRDIQTKKLSVRRVTYPNKIIRVQVNPNLIVRGPAPALRPPPSPEQLSKFDELEQLLSSLGFDSASLMVPQFEMLLAAAEGKLDWLLSRLRMLVREEYKFSHFHDLTVTVRQLYFVRE